MTVLVTGATGHLGQLVVQRLLARGTTPSDVVGGARRPDRARLPDGVAVVELDYDRPEPLGPALAGVDTLVLVSASQPGRRAQHHGAVIEAAEAAGGRRPAHPTPLPAATPPPAPAPRPPG